MPTPAKTTAKRSACDPCRAKRVRCLRAQDSTAPCARCSYLGSACITGAPGQPGRPPKRQRRASASPTHEDTASKGSTGTGTTPGSTGTALTPPATDHSIFPTLPSSTASEQAHALQSDLQPEDSTWAALALGNSPSFFGPLIDGGANAPVNLSQPQGNSLQLQSLSSLPLSPYPLHSLLRSDTDQAQNGHGGILSLGTESSGSSTAFDMDMDLLLDHDYGNCGGLSPLPRIRPPPPSAQSQSVATSAARSLLSLREEIDKRIAAIDVYYADPAAVQQWCMDDDGEENEERGIPEHPPAALLVCSKRLIDILQTLVPAQNTLTTETLLLALSGYLAVMRLFDVLFLRVHQTIAKMAMLPPVPYEALKVKSVLRIGGVATLQDMPLRAYATGMLEAIYGLMRTLEKCLGVPAEYCLNPASDGPKTSAASSSSPGLFSRPDRAKLFATVMAQEDVQSRRGGGSSYVESIRENIEGALSFFANME